MIVLERELYDRLSLISGYPKDVVRDVVKALSEFVMDELKNDIPVVLGQLGSISVMECNTPGGYNFHTKKKGDPHTYKKIKFSASKTLKRVLEENKDQ